jgi:CrcB protein
VQQVLLIALGGSLGALLRFGTVALLTHWYGPHFPWGTLAVNWTGCFLIGFAAAALEAKTTHAAMATFLRDGFMIGLLGALTTFSSFGLDTVRLASDRSGLAAASNIALHVAGGLTLVWIGIRLGRALW